MGRTKQQSLFNSQKSPGKHRFCHGGVLRKKALGRGQRPLACKNLHHIVFKLDNRRLKHRSLRASRNFKLVQGVIRQYAQRFFVEVEQLSVQSNHLHLLIRAPKRHLFHYFFRVVAGQIAQRLENENLLVTDTATTTPNQAETGTLRQLNPCAKPGVSLASKTKAKSKARLWLYRPYSRVVFGWRAIKTVKDYVQLNEKEARGEIPYRKTRLRGLSMSEWEILWK